MANTLTTFIIPLLNAFVVAGLVFLYFSFGRLIATRDASESRVYYYATVGWVFNLAYLLVLETQSHTPFLSPARLLSTVYVFNVLSSWFFALAASEVLRPTGLRRNALVFGLPGVALAMSLIPAVAPATLDRPWGWGVVPVLFVALAINALARALQVRIQQSRDRLPQGPRALIVYSLYVYAALQLAVFTVSPYSFSLEARFPWYAGVLFGIGGVLKLAHLYGVGRHVEFLYMAYERRAGDVEKARVSISLTDQLAHELETPALELNVRAKQTSPNMSIVSDLLEQISGIIRAFQRYHRSQDPRDDEARPVTESLNVICDMAIIGIKIALRPRVKFQKEYERDLHVTVVQGEINQVLRNLLKNAVEAIEQRRAVEGSGAEARVVIETKILDGDRVAAVIYDTGCGTKRGLRQRIFEDGFSTKAGTGRGHGLHIARMLTKSNGGSLSMIPPDSLPEGMVTGFAVELPITEIEDPDAHIDG